MQAMKQAMEGPTGIGLRPGARISMSQTHWPEQNTVLVIDDQAPSTANNPVDQPC